MEWKLVIHGLTWLRNNWAKVQPWVMPVALASRVPTNTFRIVLDTQDPAWWHMGSCRNEPATQIHARYYVTNIVRERMLVVECRLKPEGQDETYGGLDRHVEQMLDGGEKSPTTLVSVHGIIRPAITRNGEVLRAQIVFVDQFGNEILGPLTTFIER